MFAPPLSDILHNQKESAKTLLLGCLSKFLGGFNGREGCQFEGCNGEISRGLQVKSPCEEMVEYNYYETIYEKGKMNRSENTNRAYRDINQPTGGTPDEGGAGAGNRLLSVACYFGLAPFMWFFESAYRKNRYINHHISYSLAFIFVGICMVVFQIIGEVVLYRMFGEELLVPQQANLLDNWFYIWTTLLTILLLIISMIANFAWIISLLGALLGRVWRLPVVSSIASMRSVIYFTVCFSLLLFVLSVALIGIGVHSVQIANSQPEKADVYILYTVGGYINAPGLYETYTPPSWAVTMAFYPLVLTGLDRFGENSVSILPLSEDSFNQAIENGRFIFIASHGGQSPGKLTVSMSPYREYGPADVPQQLVGNQLQFVYFAGCDAGRLEDQWRRVLRLEDAVMFDRVSLVVEHLIWVWTKSPMIISALK